MLCRSGVYTPSNDEKFDLAIEVQLNYLPNCYKTVSKTQSHFQIFSLLVEFYFNICLTRNTIVKRVKLWDLLVSSIGWMEYSRIMVATNHITQGEMQRVDYGVTSLEIN